MAQLRPAGFLRVPLWAALFITLCPGFAGASCSSQGNCLLCTSSWSWSGFGCRWCPVDNTCHEYGGMETVCTFAQLVSDVAQCAAEPDPPSAYDARTARQALALASAGYCGADHILSWQFDEPSCAELLEGFAPDAAVHSAASNAFGYVAHNDAMRLVVVGFKGTSSTSDIFDIDFIIALNLTYSYKHPCELLDGSGRTLLTVNSHPGFCSYYQSLNDGSGHGNGGSLARAVEAAHEAHPMYSVLFVGHSLGGAAAALQAVAFGLSTGSPSRLITFGQPRTGDVTLSASMARARVTAIRLTHGRDLVPHVSVCCSLLSSCSSEQYCPLHHDREVWYPSSVVDPLGPHRVCAAGAGDGGGAFGEDDSCSDGLFPTTLASIEDHLYYFGTEVGSGCCKKSRRSIGFSDLVLGAFEEILLI